MSTIAATNVYSATGQWLHSKSVSWSSLTLNPWDGTGSLKRHELGPDVTPSVSPYDKKYWIHVMTMTSNYFKDYAENRVDQHWLSLHFSLEEKGFPITSSRSRGKCNSPDCTRYRGNGQIVLISTVRVICMIPYTLTKILECMSKFPIKRHALVSP